MPITAILICFIAGFVGFCRYIHKRGTGNRNFVESEYGVDITTEIVQSLGGIWHRKNTLLLCFCSRDKRTRYVMIHVIAEMMHAWSVIKTGETFFESNYVSPKNTFENKHARCCSDNLTNTLWSIHVSPSDSLDDPAYWEETSHNQENLKRKEPGLDYCVCF